MKSGWVRVALIVLAGGIAGALVAFLMISYYPHKLYVIEDPQQAYDIVTDLTTIVVMILAVIAALGGLVIGWLIHRAVYSQLSEQLNSRIEECINIIFANLHKATTSLWGQLYEQFPKRNDLIEIAISEGKKAVSFAEKLNEKEYWEIKLKATNNYLLSLADKGKPQDLSEAHHNLAPLERILEEHKKDFGILSYQEYLETIYFIRWRFPLTPEDKKKAQEDFFTLRGHPDFDDWRRRWKDFGLKAANP